jgi:hypothetical protein
MNCGAPLHDLETIWASKDGLFCTEDCGILFNYFGKPLQRDIESIKVAISARKPGESPCVALIRLYTNATERWEKTAEEISPKDIGI